MIDNFDAMTDEEYLEHYGTPRHSGRYPWGSGDNPYQHEKWFLGRYREMREAGMSEDDIVKAFNLDGEEIKSIKELRMKNSIYSEDDRLENIKRAQRLREKGYSLETIADMMGASGESTVRGWLKQGQENKVSLARATADKLEEELKKKKYLNVGTGVERELNISRDKLDTALYLLKEKGYFVDNIYVPQVTSNDPTKKTTIRILAPEGTTKPELYKNKDQISTINLYSPDGGSTFRPFRYPESLDSSRVKIVYAEEGGKDKDGVIELRRGVEDISLGASRYAQVRIMVDGTHYLKGMAMYSDNMPDGVDVLFNTNKHVGTPKEDVFKPLKIDKGTGEIDRDNPFGATIKLGPSGQREYVDPADGKTKMSKINIVNEEGDWDSWSKTLSSQFLAKQDLSLIRQQLKATSDRKHQEYDEIMALENESVKKALLKEFADDCDSSAVHLKAVSLPRQSSKVILPLTTLKENEVYAPTYNDGEQLALVRHPHGGTFEIPILTVNNKNKQGRSLLGNTRDAIGITSKTAETLSGADFDGDSVVCIPLSEKARIKNSSLKELQNFDPKESYPGYEGMKKMSSQQKQIQMGVVSNLITDMTIKGAKEDEIARAVKHSMVVIDAEKHGLNWKQSEKDFRIGELREKYQTTTDLITGEKKIGASTVMSRAKNEVRIPERQLVDKEGKRAYTADPETGEYLYAPTDRTYVTYNKKTGQTKEKKAQTVLGQMEYVDDARKLSSGTAKEEAYARYANDMKGLAREARKSYLNTKPPKADPVAKVKYKDEVDSLMTKLDAAERNRPKERQAQLVANTIIEAKLRDNPDLKDDKEHYKRLKNQALNQARIRLGARRVEVDITPKEWEAIQSKAVSPTTLDKILEHTNMDKVRDYATPKNRKTMTDSMVSRAKAMDASGNYTTAEIAQALGVSVATISNYVNS